MKILVIIFLLFFSFYSQALTWKSDGSVISSKGEIIKDSYAVIYRQKYKSFRENIEINDWPLAGSYHQNGYFGKKIFIDGFPLPKNPKGKFNLEGISKFNGISKNEFLFMVIAFANDEWLQKNLIDKSIALELRKNIQASINIEIDFINALENELNDTLNNITKEISREVTNESSSSGSLACSESGASGVEDSGGSESSGLEEGC